MTKKKQPPSAVFRPLPEHAYVPWQTTKYITWFLLACLPGVVFYDPWASTMIAFLAYSVFRLYETEVCKYRQRLLSNYAENEHPEFEQAMVGLAAIGGQKILQFDSSQSDSPITIPAGVYSMKDVAWSDNDYLWRRRPQWCLGTTCAWDLCRAEVK